ncbi:MAG: TetR/AcrR family transcriptional regulator [Ilumatobacteraceae bacterium]
MPSIKGARERARAEITAEIMAEARRQLAVAGPTGLSLRAVARELGMVSSGIYRYVASRDELLTMLIIEAYDALGATVERTVAASAGQPAGDRFVGAALAVRQWAQANPHEYALVYGSPVPGYAAPADTIGPASRVTLALVGIVVDAQRAGSIDPPPAVGGPVPVPVDLRADLDRARAALDVDLPDDLLVRVLAAWTQLFGLVSFELFGQTANVIEAHHALLDATATAMARLIGLPMT